MLAAAQRSYSGCLQYKENVRDARATLRGNSGSDVDVTYVADWHEHPGFIDANADHVRAALMELPEDVRRDARVVFTAHSIPTSMAARYPYEEQLRDRRRGWSRRLSTGATGRSSSRAGAGVPRILGSSRT